MRPMRLVCLLACTCGTVAAARGAVPEATLNWTTQASGVVQIQNVGKVRYTYHYNRNALEDAVVLGDGVIALSESGNLLRFERESLALVREAFGSPPAYCIGCDSRQQVYVGLVDGQICRVEPQTLGLTCVTTLADLPVWIGPNLGSADAHALYVITSSPLGRDTAGPNSICTYRLHDIESGRSIPFWRREIGSYASNAALRPIVMMGDDERLWIAPRCEDPNAAVGFIDLRAGQYQDVLGAPPGVYGFVGNYSAERQRTLGAGHAVLQGWMLLPDGRVWFYGGAINGIGSRSFIAEVSSGYCDVVWESTTQTPYQIGLGGPESLIEFMLPASDGRSVLTVARDEVYELELATRIWNKRADIQVGDSFGVARCNTVRPLGPAALEVLVVGDGFSRLEAGSFTSHRLSHQIGSDRIGQVMPTPTGAMLVPQGASLLGDAPWRLENGGWATVPVVPDTLGIRNRSEHPYTIFAGMDQTYLTVAEAGYPTEIVVTRWGKRPAEVIARFSPGLPHGVLNGVFPSPDGRLWSAWHRGIALWSDSGWLPVGDAVPAPWGGCRVIADLGPPWLLQENGPPWRTPASGDSPPLKQLVFDGETGRVTIRDYPLSGEGPMPRRVYDALGWDEGQLLLATDVGLRLCTVANGRLTDPPFPVPDEQIRRICRDGSGRIWLGGNGLWMADPRDNQIADIRSLPPVGTCPINALGTDPLHPTAVWLGVGSHGVVAVDVPTTDRR